MLRKLKSLKKQKGNSRKVGSNLQFNPVCWQEARELNSVSTKVYLKGAGNLNDNNRPAVLPQEDPWFF
jgi:hypothetical protein